MTESHFPIPDTISTPSQGGRDHAHAPYIPGRTLGRFGIDEDHRARLGFVLAQLDGLMCVLSDQQVQVGDANSFQGMNMEIQRAVLGLASDLAFEAHELHERLFVCGEGAQQ